MKKQPIHLERQAWARDNMLWRGNLEGKTILPGLIDSHVHPIGASSFEYDHPVPDVKTISGVFTGAYALSPFTKTSTSCHV